MRIVNAAVAILLFALAFYKANVGEHLWWVGVYGFGGTLALVALRDGLSIALVRVLAALSVLTMLGYFGAFFLTVPYNDPQWVSTGGLAFSGLLFAGFAMMPVLSEFSCRMKSGTCGQEREARHAARAARASHASGAASTP